MRHRWISLAAIASFMLCAPGAAHAQNGFRVELREAHDAESVSIRRWMEQAEILTVLAHSLNRWVRMPRPVTLRGAECATSDVRWVPEEASVEVCYRMLVRLRGLLRADSTRGAFSPALAFIVLHGVAHAVVDELDLPTLAGEEQAVDEVMAFHLVPQGQEVGIRLLQGVQALQGADAGWGAWEWARTHQITPERVQTIACLAYGANPSYFTQYRSSGLLPAARAGGCAAAYNRAYHGLGRRLTRSLN